MKVNRFIFSLCLLALNLEAYSYTPLTLPVIPPDPAIEKKVRETVSKMSLEEKIGQMTQIQVDIIGDYDKDGKFCVSDEKMDTVFGIYKIGSILNTPSRTCLNPEEWNVVISKIQSHSMKSIGIPCIYGLDQNHGANYSVGGTLFPQNINAAATFDSDMVKRMAEITAYETRASDCPWTFSPTLDLARDPRWPRFWENYGEDPLINAVMGASAVRGFQGNNPNHIDENHIAVSIKHFMGYGVPFSGKDRTPAYISASDLREKHFAPYLEAIKNGALTLMVNSSSINGTPVHANYQLLTQWIKHDLQWDGMIVTDWSDINNLYKRERVAKDKKDAIRIAINAGIDMAMEPYDVNFCRLLKELVEEGSVPMSRIDDAASRVIRLKYRLGLFKQPNTTLKEHPLFGCSEFRETALQAAERSIILLKNDNDLLPIKPGTKILLTGPTANSMRSLNGGWSYTWQGGKTDIYAEKFNTIHEAICNRFGNENINYIPTVTFKSEGSFEGENVSDFSPAVEAAKKSDIIIICIGENSYCETPGNLSNLLLSENQRNLVKAKSSFKMGSIITIISILGSLTSIYAFIHSIKLKDSIRNMVTYGILLLTSVISGVCFYLYHQETDTKIQYEKQKETVRLEAKNLLENVPSSIDYYNPGENEGLLLSTLALLERNKDIFPETYEAYKLEVIQKMKNADNESDIFRKREQMEIAGNSAIRLLKSLAQ